jgi:hypothetical protein
MSGLCDSSSLFIKKREFKFEFYFSNTMTLIPVNLGKPNSNIDQADPSYSPKLAPSALAILLSQAHTFAHVERDRLGFKKTESVSRSSDNERTGAPGDRFNFTYISDNDSRRPQIII